MIYNNQLSNNSTRYIKAKICLYISENTYININDFIYHFEGNSPISILIALKQLSSGFNNEAIKDSAKGLLWELYDID